MDSSNEQAGEFDALVKAFATGRSRRAAVRTAFGVAVSGALGLYGADAKRHKGSSNKDKRAKNAKMSKHDHGKDEEGTTRKEVGSLEEHRRSHYDTTIGIRAPWALNNTTSYATWKVVQGYQASPNGFHCSSQSNKQALSFDLIPETGNAGGRSIYAPVSGVTTVYYIGAGRGYAVEIKTSNGYRVALYHLMSLAVSHNRQISANTYLGKVFNQYNYAGTTLNHLHLHVNDPNGNPVPLKIAGRLYSGSTSDRCVYPGKWAGTKIRENALFKETYHGGSSVLRVLSSAVGIAGSSYTAWNDSVSSVRVNDGCSVTLYQHTYYTGSSVQVNPYGANTLPSYIDNQTSSLRLTCS